jgi:hypothetical protein
MNDAMKRNEWRPEAISIAKTAADTSLQLVLAVKEVGGTVK